MLHREYIWICVGLAGGQTDCRHVEWNNFCMSGQIGEVRGAAGWVRDVCFGTLKVQALGD